MLCFYNPNFIVLVISVHENVIHNNQFNSITGTARSPIDSSSLSSCGTKSNCLSVFSHSLCIVFRLPFLCKLFDAQWSNSPGSITNAISWNILTSIWSCVVGGNDASVQLTIVFVGMGSLFVGVDSISGMTYRSLPLWFSISTSIESAYQ